MQAPPKIQPPPSLAFFTGIVLGAAALGVGAVVFFFNPGTHSIYPICVFHKLTGLNCPGCGMTRALYALLHGDFLTALRDNALFVSALVFAAFRGAWSGWKKLKGEIADPFFPAQSMWILLILAVGFGIVRNLPGFEWLSPG